MKKIFYFLMALPLIFGLNSCSDDDKLPDVDLDVTFSNCVIKDNVIYVVQGETLQIDAITPVNHTDKKCVLGAANYFWDYELVGTNVVEPYSAQFPTQYVQVGPHRLSFTIGVYVVDYPVCFGAGEYAVQVVASADDLPTDGAENPTINAAARITSGE